MVAFSVDIENFPVSKTSPILKLAAGPAAFLLIYFSALEGVSYNGRVILATLAWAVVWWMTKPVPWAITSLLPLVIFPVLGVMPIRETTALYGQRIFFWLLGITMLGYALQKHGLANRIALKFLGLKGMANTTRRLLFMYMLATAVLSMFITDTAVVGMMIPLGMSICAFVSKITGSNHEGSHLASFFALGTLYAAVAGGVATIAGSSHNAIGAALAESLVGEQIGFFRWMTVGLPLFVVLFIAFYLLLVYFYPPEISTIPGGREFLDAELKKLGKMTRGEVNVLVTIGCMVFLFTFPALFSLVLGEAHPWAEHLRTALPTWVVPGVILFLLFLLPVDFMKGEGTLVWRDVAEHAPWNIIFLCTGAVAMTDALTQFGFRELMTGKLETLEMGASLPFLVTLTVAVSTNFVSGTAAVSLFCSIFIPLAANLGFNPVSMAILIPNAGVGVMTPWAGASAGTAFASGYLKMTEMVKVGLVATALIILLTTGIHMLFAPIL